MKTYDFDKVYDRRGSGAVKWDLMKEEMGRDDLQCLWVADMDLPTPDFIIDALRRRLDHPFLGYGMIPGGWYDSCLGWVNRRHGLEASREDILFIPGIVRGIAFALQALSREQDKILVMDPVYHPFFLVPRHNRRQAVFSTLEIRDERLDIDFRRLDKDLEDCRMMILCNPHNPGGRVWSRQELEQIAALAEKHQVLVISDEIHCDLTLPGHKHISYATVSHYARYQSITFMAPSKTFNVPGLCSSMAFIFNDEIRKIFNGYMEASELGMGNIMAYEVAMAAFTPEGEDWLDQLLGYIKGNIDLTEDYLKRNLPMVRMMRTEASFLIFLDFRALEMEQNALESLMLDKAHLFLNSGTMFGASGKGFMRMNVALPRTELEKALESIRKAVQEIRES